ncbi:MAG: hypothetical protein ACR2HR_02125 [Euzebya sp.]
MSTLDRRVQILLDARHEAGQALLAAEPMPVEDWEVMKRKAADEMSGL